VLRWKMSRREAVIRNVEIVQKKLYVLRDSLGIMEISKGQETYINMLLGLINEQVERASELLDRKKYNEALIELEDMDD
jgi:hypothetical protein